MREEQKQHSEFDVIREGILPPVREGQFVDSEMLAEPKRQALFALRRLEEQLEAEREKKAALAKYLWDQHGEEAPTAYAAWVEFKPDSVLSAESSPASEPESS